MGAPVEHRQRHRRRPAGAARHRRRAGLPRPLPPRVADHPRAPASRSPGCSRCSTRCRCSCPACSSWSSSGSARGTPSQGTITPGELVAFYGYSAFLMIPLRTATEYANKLIRARVAAARVCRVLALDPEVSRARASSPRPRRRRRRSPTGAAACVVRAGPAHRDRQRAARRVRRRWPTGSAWRASPVDDEVTPRRRPADRAVAATRCAAGSSCPTPARCCSPAGSATGSTSPARGDVERALDTAVGRRHPRGAARRPRHRWSPSAAAASPAASGSGWCWPARCRRPGDPGAGRADLGGRRPHRGPDRGRGCGAHRAGRTTVVTTTQPADAGRRRRGRVPARRAGRRHRHPRASCSTRAPTTAAS